MKTLFNTMNITRGQLAVCLLSAAGHLPLWACRLLGRILGLLLWLFPNRNRQTTATNIQLCFPDYSYWQQVGCIFSSLQHTGMLVFETAAIWNNDEHWLAQRILGFNNIHLFEQAQKNPQGLVILLPHLGNWEVFSRYIPSVCDAVGLYEPPKIIELERLIKKSREKTGATMVPTNPRGVARLLKHLKVGGTTCILPDQVPNKKDRGGVFAPFFGHPCYTMTLVNQLHQRTDAHIITAVAERVRGGFLLHFYPVDNAIYNKDNTVSASAMNAGVEHCIRAIPSQYQWEYKRFRRQPKGGKKIYS